MKLNYLSHLKTALSLSLRAQKILMPYEGFPIEERSLRWLLVRDPARRSTGGTPVAYVLHGIDTNGAQLIEFWPRYSDAQAVRVPFYKRVDDLSGSSIPLIRSDLVEALALQYAYSRLSTEFGDPQYPREREYWSEVLKGLSEIAQREDQARHNLPRSVQDERTGAIDWDYYITHDVG